MTSRAVMHDKVMEGLFQGAASAFHLCPSTSPVNDEWEDEFIPLEETHNDELEHQGEQQESGDDMFDFCEKEENLTFAGKNENLTQDVNDEQQSFHEQPDTASIDSTPLYPAAKVTLGTAVLLLGLFSIKFNFSAEAMGNLLPLLSLIVPAGHVLPTTVNKFKQYFHSLSTPMILHYYCSFCLTYVGRNRSLGTCPTCVRDLRKSGALAYFVDIVDHHSMTTFGTGSRKQSNLMAGYLIYMTAGSIAN